MGPWALVVGESLVDIVHVGGAQAPVVLPGGSPKNVAVALSRLGRRVGFLTCVGRDEHGREIVGDLQRAGIELLGEPYAVGRTSTAAATLARDGSASYDFDVEWRLPPVPDEAVDPPPLVLHTGSLAAVLPPGADDVLDLVRRMRGRATVCYDVNARPALTGAGPAVVVRVEALAALADVVKVSEEDLEAFWPGVPAERAARALLDLGPRVVALTRGAAGATWLAGGVEVSVPAPPVDVVDTIGAGDTFVAALIDGLWERGRLGADLDLDLDLDAARLVLEHAAAAAAVTVSRRGADPPTRQEL